jgi:23S rRNA (guanosine2251-2'-O)-methyltransferase
VEVVKANRARVHEVIDVLDLAETSTPQGIVARCRPIEDSTLEELAGGVMPAVVVLDHVVDPHNLGAIARTVLAAGFGGLVVSGRRAAPLSATAFKSAAGALERVRVSRINSVADAVARLKRLGLWAIGLEANASAGFWGHPIFTEPLALVVGEEGSGLSRLVRDRLDLSVRIPIAKETESLNVSVAVGVVAFEVARMRSVA